MFFFYKDFVYRTQFFYARNKKKVVLGLKGLNSEIRILGVFGVLQIPKIIFIS